MRVDALEMVYQLAREDERVVFIGSDLGGGTLQKFRDEMPERFFMEGVSEAHIVGMAAGLAREGHVVYCNTIAPFFVRRAYEQIAIDLCMHELPVRLIANGGGLVYAPLGPTHMAVEDIALMRALPGMSILAPADAPEMRRQMRVVHAQAGPVYIRLGKGNEPDITVERESGQFAVVYREGRDAVIICTGIMLHHALAAVESLEESGIFCGVVHCPWVKPLDLETIAVACAGKRLVVTLEEHVATGGLGSAVAECMLELPPGERAPVFKRLALPDAFPQHYGSQAEHLRHHALDGAGIAGRVQSLWEGV